MQYFTLPYQSKNVFYGKNIFGDNIKCFEITEDRKVKAIFWHELTIHRDFLTAFAAIQKYVDELK